MTNFLTKKIVFWALYDFANTIFSMNIVTLYFPLFLIQNLGGKEIHLSIATSASMFIGAIVSPFYGMMSDKSFKKNHLLAATTILSCIFTALIPVFTKLSLCIIFFILANFFYQISLIAYDSLLPSATEEKHIGIVSGFGVALGYGGTFLALIIGKLIVKSTEDNYLIFLPTAMLFLTFSIPCFFVKDIKQIKVDSFELMDTIKNILKDKNLLFYFVGHILYLDAVNTVIAFMAVFLVKIGGFSQEQGEINNFFLFSTVFATLGGLFWGVTVRRVGARTGLLWTLLLWCFLLLLVLFPITKTFFWFLGPITGFALAGTWSCDRPLLLSLIGKGESGRYFGFYYLTGKISSVVGPLIFGLLLSLPFHSDTLKYRLAFLSLLIMIMIATVCIKKISLKAVIKLEKG